MATNPDIRLLVGVDTGLSYNSMKDGISEVVKRLNDNPPKIKLSLDSTEIDNKIQLLRSQITEIGNQKIYIGATGELQGTLGTISNSLEVLSQKISGIGESANFNNLAESLKSISPVIENLKSELGSLQSATQNFQGINLNIGLGGSNAIARNSQYSSSAKQTLAQLKEQALALEEVFKQHTKITNGFNAVWSTVKGTDILKAKDIFSILQGMNTPKTKDVSWENLIQPWRDYIQIMQDAAKIRGIDITSVTSSFTKSADEMIENTRKVLSGEAELESSVGKLKSIFGSGINSEVLNEQLNTINNSINGVSNAIANLKLDGSSLNTFVESVNKLSGAIENLISAMGNITNRNTSMSEGINSVARAAQKASASLGEYTVKLDESNRKILSDNLSLEHSKIDDFVRRLADLKISAQAVKARWEEITEAGQRLTRVIIDGANAQNDAVKHTIEFDKKTGEISKEYTEVVHKAKAVKEEIRGAGDASAKSKNETKETKANLEAIDGLIKSIEKTNSSLNSSKNKVTDALGGLSSTGQNKAELEEINKKFDELMVATERLKTNRMTANQEDVDGLRKIQEELDALIRKSQERLRIEAESKDLSSATSAEKNVSRIKEMLNTKDIDASVAKVTDRFEKLGDSGAKGLGRVKTGIVQINTLLASLKSPQVLSNDNALLSTYQRLSTLLETVSNKISIIESRTNTAKKINFGIDTEKFKTDIDVLQQKLNKLTNKTAPLYSIITKNMTKLRAAFQQMNNSASTQAQRVTAYERLKKLIRVVTKQIRIQTAEETAAANAAKKAKAEAVRGAKQQILENEQANVQRRIAYHLIAQIAQAQKEWTKARNGSMSNEYSKLQSYSSQLTTLLNQLSSGTIGKSDFSAQVKNIGNEFVRTSSIIRTAGEDTKTLADRFGSLGSKFSIWFSTTRIIMMVYTNIRKMISASIELDKTMTQLQIVTKQNDDAMAKFGDSAAAAAKRIGSSITDFVSSATTYARLGYSLDESSRLAEFTAMLQNVGDIDVSEAQDAITSIVKAFNIGTDQIESVMDKMVIAGK